MSREQTTPMEVAAEALGASMGYAGGILSRGVHSTEQIRSAAQTMATAAQAAATLELAKQQRIQNLIALSAAGGNLGVSPTIQQAALQTAAAALIDVDAAMAGVEGADQ